MIKSVINRWLIVSANFIDLNILIIYGNVWQHMAVYGNNGKLWICPDFFGFTYLMHFEGREVQSQAAQQGPETT